jgi:putative membrane protein
MVEPRETSMSTTLRLLLTITVAALFGLPRLSLAAADDKAHDSNSSDSKTAFDKRFVKEAAQYAYAENELSRLAREQSRSEGVKHFAELNIGGNKKIIDDLQEIAKGHDYVLSDELTDKQKDTKERIGKLKGTDFDVEYMSSAVEDHEAMVQLFERASKECQDEKLRDYANRRLPAVREHLDNAKELYKKVKNKEDKVK